MITNKKQPSAWQVLFAFMCGACLILILYYSDCAIEYMRTGLLLCTKTVIPSLFPFMVISELIVSSGLGEFIGKMIRKICQLLFGISGVSACAVILGALCGFPIGAKTTVSLLDNKYIDKKETERLLCFCNNPSSAFLISAVGISLYSSKQVGLIFYITTLSTAVLIGMVLKWMYGGFTSNTIHTSTKSIPGISCFTSAVSGSAHGMLTVCAYVVFFSAVMGCLGHMLAELGCPSEICALLYGVVELSGGVSASAALGNGALSLCLSAFIMGWSGISVHCQIMSICHGKGLKFTSYVVSKLIHGILNSIVIYCIYIIAPQLFQPDQNSASIPSFLIISSLWQNMVLVFFILSLCFYFFGKIHKSTLHVIY